MSERRAEALLTALRRAVRHVALYPVGHPLVEEALHSGADAANEVALGGEAVLTMLDDAFYLGTELLGHASLEFNGMLREMQQRGIDSITMIKPVAAADLAELAAFIAGTSDDVPAGSSIRLNERPLSYEDLRKSDTGGLRTSYTASLDVLRSIGMAVHNDGEFGLGGVAAAVENLLKASLEQPGASLLLATVKSHDEYTFYHSVNTCILALAMGRLVGLDEDQLRLLGMGALLHDIGKVGVAPSVLRNPGRLVSGDWDQIKLHPQEGAQSILAASGTGQELAAAIALEHHARFDGSGYPKLGHDDGHAGHSHNGNGHSGNGHGGNGHGGNGHQLHFYSRLVSVSDTYDAITTRRSYRRAETPGRALNVLLNGAGTSYDPDFVRAFIHLMGAYPAGSLLQVRGGEIVMVVHQDVEDSERPAVVIVRDATGERVDPEPFPFHVGDVVDQLLPDRAGVDPASLLELVAGN